MSFLRKEPGVVFASIFIVMGLTFVLAVSVGERISPVAGQGFGEAIIDGGDWQAGQFPPIPMN